MTGQRAVDRERVVVVGLGYVGLPLAVRAAEAGFAVTGVDSDAAKVDGVLAGHSYVDDVSDLRLKAAVADGALSARLVDGTTTILPRFDIAVIAVPTPLTDGAPDLSYVVAAARLVGRSLAPGATVVLESTSFPGTTERVVASMVEEESGLLPGTDYHLGFSPERIDPGNTVHTFETTPKLVSGTTAESLVRVKGFYDRLVDHTVSVSTPAVAEFAKVFENIFSQVNIALVNEMAMVAHRLDIDIWEVLAAADTKPHGFLKHLPGPGVGGHCLPVDPAYLSWLVKTELGTTLRLSDLAQEINDGMPTYVVGRAAAMLPGGLAGAKVLVLGVAYKAGTSDLRESPAIDVVAGLLDAGADVTVCDPHVGGWTSTATIGVEELHDRVADHDLVVLVTDHAEFDYDTVASRAALVLDCRRSMTPSPTVVSL